MKKNSRKILALILALLCVSSLWMTAFADGEDGIGSAVAADGTTINGVGETAQESDSIIDANALKSRIDSYITEQGIGGKNKVISIGYCYTATGDSWYYDGDQWCYSASLYKVPCCMLLAEKEYNGEITKDTMITTQYASGTVDYMERKSIVESDNYTGHAIVEYLGGTYNGKCADQTIKFTSLPEDYFPSDFKDYSYYSAKYYTQVLQTLFKDSDKFPRILDYMKQDQSYHYLDKDLNGAYQVAQKYGAFEEKNGNKNYHSAGIVYTPNPVIITVMTKNITGFEKHIGALSKILVDYTLELDSQLAAYNANKLIAQQQEAARLAQEEQQRLAQEAAAQQAMAQAAVQTPAPTPVTSTATSVQPNQGTSIFMDPTPSPAASSSSAENTPVWFSLPVIAGLGLVALIFIIVFIIKLRNSKMEEEEFDEEDYEDYMRGDISELAPREEKKKSSWKDRYAEKQQDEEYDQYDQYDDYDDAYEEKYVDSYAEEAKPAKKKKSLFGRKAKNEDYEAYDEPGEAHYEDEADDRRYNPYPENRGKGNGYEDEYADPYEDNNTVNNADPAPSAGMPYASSAKYPASGNQRKANPVTYVDSREDAQEYGYDADPQDDYSYDSIEAPVKESAKNTAAKNAPDPYSDLYSDDSYGAQNFDSSYFEDDYADQNKAERPAKKSSRFSRGNGYTPKH